MGISLCAELLDFAAAERRHGAPDELPACVPGTCPGLGHLADVAGAAIPGHADRRDGLLRRFGAALLVTLARRYPSFFVGISSTSELIAACESQLPSEIAKLAPDIVLPALAVVSPGRAHGVCFTCRFPDGRSDLAPFVEGMVAGSVRHFAEPLDVACVRGPEPGAASIVVEPRAHAAAGRTETQRRLGGRARRRAFVRARGRGALLQR